MRVKDQINAHFGKSGGDITVEGAIDETEPHSTDTVLPDVNPNIAQPKISPEPGAGEGWGTEPAPLAHPEDWLRPGYSDEERA